MESVERTWESGSTQLEVLCAYFLYLTLLMKNLYRVDQQVYAEGIIFFDTNVVDDTWKDSRDF